jgi:hypothetical protein
MLINFFTRWFPLIILCIPDVFVNYSHFININYTKSSKISLLAFCWVFLQQVWILFYLSCLLNYHARKCNTTLFKPYYTQQIFLLSISSFLVYLLPSFLSSFLPTFLPSFHPSFLFSLLPVVPPSYLFSLLYFLPFFPPFFIPTFLSNSKVNIM